jgi:hypothetical protein
MHPMAQRKKNLLDSVFFLVFVRTSFFLFGSDFGWAGSRSHGKPSRGYALRCGLRHRRNGSWLRTPRLMGLRARRAHNLSSIKRRRAPKDFSFNENIVVSAPSLLVLINNKASNTNSLSITFFSALGLHAEHRPRALPTLQPPLQR